MSAIDDARRVLLDAVASSVFPAAVVDVGASSGTLWREALGTLTFDEASPPAVEATPFDLASLTKVIATTPVVMRLVHAKAIRLDERVGEAFSEWRGADREAVTVQDLLEHASGLPARLVDAPPLGRREFEHEICSMSLEYEPRTRSVYSDLGFILLGFLAADRAGRTLAAQFDSIRQVLGGVEPAMMSVSFGLDAVTKPTAAPTIAMDDDRRRGRRLIGDVHDNYAAALGGVAGHAGLFGTAPAVAGFARAVLRAARGDSTIPDPLSPSLVKRFIAKTATPHSSRGLGWDTMLTTSSCGTHLSSAAFGHVGFTGTSLWIDPLRDRYFVLLTNRACGGGTPDEMRAARRAFHDALGDL